jgi:hypothetical protein
MRSKKFFYVPGLISLISLPILFFFWPIQDPPDYVVLKFFLASDFKPPKGVMDFSKYRVLQDIKNKKITRIYLGDVFAYDDKDEFRISAREKFVIAEIERLAFVDDTTQVLQVELDGENTYGDFVGLVNLAAIYRIKRYAYFDDSFFFMANPPPVSSRYYEDHGGIENYIPDNWMPPTNWEVFIGKLRYEWRIYWEEFSYPKKQNYPVSAGFVALIVIPWIIWLRRNRRRVRLQVMSNRVIFVS